MYHADSTFEFVGMKQHGIQHFSSMMASQTSVRSARPDRVPGATRTLALLAAAQLLAMSLWFTGTAVIPVLTA